MLKKYFSIVFVIVLLLQSLPAFADHDHDRGRDRDRREHGWDHGYVVHRLPPGYREIFWEGLSYLYLEGIFYRYTPAGYIIAEPPVGAVVPVLPSGYTAIRVQQTPYYYVNDTYYIAVPNGYAVAPSPATPVPVPAVVSTSMQAGQEVKNQYKGGIDTYDIYIPNNDGSYTLVTLKKAEKGFVGPQGELYPEHPTVEKLKMLYGKK